MGKEFVPYELTLKLKDIGFNSGNEYCFGFYTEEYKKLVKGYNRLPIDLPTNSFEAPLWQQAFYWFLFEKEWYSSISPNHSENCWQIYIQKSYKDFGGWGTTIQNQYKTYEEARLACLEKLIELIKEKENGKNL